MTESTDDDLLAQAVTRAAAAARWSPAEVARVTTWARRMPMANRSDFLDVAAETWCQKHLDKYEDYTMKFDRSPLAFREEFASVFIGVLREASERLERLAEAKVADPEDLTLLRDLKSVETRAVSSGARPPGASISGVPATGTQHVDQAATPIEVPVAPIEHAAGASRATDLESSRSPSGNTARAEEREGDVLDLLRTQLSSCDVDLSEPEVLRFLGVSDARTLREYREVKGYPRPRKSSGRNVHSLRKVLEWCRERSVTYSPHALPERVKQMLSEARDSLAARDRAERFNELGRRHADEQFLDEG